MKQFDMINYKIVRFGEISFSEINGQKFGIYMKPKISSYSLGNDYRAEAT